MGCSSNVYGLTQWRDSRHMADHRISSLVLSLVNAVHVLLLLFIFEAAQTVSHALSSTDNSEISAKFDEISDNS